MQKPMYDKIYFFCLFLFLFMGCQSNDESTSPNVLFILADDYGYHDLGVTGSSFYETPNLDKLANSAIRFTQGYASSRVCSPSRASIMTGQHTATHAITDWIGARYGEAWREAKRNDQLLPPAYQMHLKKEWTTMPEVFNAAGYTTFFAGKWHLGGEGNGPLEHGFDYNKGGWDRGSPIGGYFSPWENPYLENKIDGENLSMRLAKETATFLEKNTDKPFFAFLSFYAVHGPIQTTEQKWKSYRDKADQMGIQDTGFVMERVLPIRVVQDNPVYAGLVEHMDDAIGMVLDKLEELGMSENTIVVFTSDNGGVASGDAFSTSNSPLRGGKGYQWEGGIREPYFIRIPNQAPRNVDFPVTGADFYPTLLELAGLALPDNHTVDGQNIVPVIEGKKGQERSLYWHYPHYGNQGGEPSSIIRKGSKKLIHYWEDGRNELYDLNADPEERKDLSNIDEGLTAELENELLRFLEKTNAGIPEKDLEHDPLAREKLMQFRRDTLLPRLEKQRMRFLDKNFQPNKTWWDSQPITKD
jgi:arylsulfatase A-like enzyme